MILFLDFDGVLHPHSASDEGLFSCRPILWCLLRAHHDVSVVFATSWRDIYSPDELVRFVTLGGGEDLVGRFIGATPMALNKNADAQRLQECLLWLSGNGQSDSGWVVLDDTPDFYPANLQNLILIDRETGLTTSNLNLIKDRVMENTTLGGVRIQTTVSN